VCIVILIQYKVNLFSFTFTIPEITAVVNALPLEAARATSILSHLIATTFQVSSHWTYSLLYYSVFAAYTLLCAVTLTVTFDLKHWHCVACDMMKLCTTFERNRSIRGQVIAI